VLLVQKDVLGRGRWRADVVEGEQVDYALRVRRKEEYGLGDDSDGGGDLTSSHPTAIRVLYGHGCSNRIIVHGEWDALMRSESAGESTRTVYIPVSEINVGVWRIL